MAGEKKVAIYHRPDWHPNLSQILGEIKGEKGYVTEMGTIRLLGPIHENPDLSEGRMQSEIVGPTQMLTAESSLGWM